MHICSLELAAGELQGLSASESPALGVPSSARGCLASRCLCWEATWLKTHGAPVSCGSWGAPGRRSCIRGVLGGLDWMTHRGPFQPRTFCDSVILELRGGFSSSPEDAGVRGTSCLQLLLLFVTLGAREGDARCPAAGCGALPPDSPSAGAAGTPAPLAQR